MKYLLLLLCAVNYAVFAAEQPLPLNVTCFNTYAYCSTSERHYFIPGWTMTGTVGDKIRPGIYYFSRITLISDKEDPTIQHAQVIYYAER